MPEINSCDCEVKEILAYIADNRQLGDHLHDPEPDPDVLGPLGHGPPGLTDELLCVQSDLHPVVDEGEQGSQGEGRHEDCYEAKLKNWETENNDHRLTRDTYDPMTSVTM